MLDIMQFERIPSIGAILGTQGQKDVLDIINSKLGGSSFFGSSSDPFAQQQRYFIDRVVQPIRFVAHQFKQQFSEMTNRHENVIRPIVSLQDLEYGIPECMWMPIAMHPTIKKLGEQRRVDLFGYDPKKLPDENPYLRLLNNGCDVDVDRLRKEGDNYMYTVEIRSDDPDLTDDELEAIGDTYNFIDLYYSKLDEMFESIGKKDILESKSYLSGGKELRDLDFTSFPNLKG